MRGRRRAPFEVGTDASEPARGGRRHGFWCESSRDRPVVRSSRPCKLGLATSPRQASAHPTPPEALRRPPDASPGSDPERSGAIPARPAAIRSDPGAIESPRGLRAPARRGARRARAACAYAAPSTLAAPLDCVLGAFREPARRAAARLFLGLAATSRARRASTGPAERSGGHTTLTYDFTSAAPSVPRGPVGGMGSSRRAASRRARRPPRRGRRYFGFRASAALREEAEERLRGVDLARRVVLQREVDGRVAADGAAPGQGFRGGRPRLRGTAATRRRSTRSPRRRRA